MMHSISISDLSAGTCDAILQANHINEIPSRLSCTLVLDISAIEFLDGRTESVANGIMIRTEMVRYGLPHCHIAENIQDVKKRYDRQCSKV